MTSKFSPNLSKPDEIIAWLSMHTSFCKRLSMCRVNWFVAVFTTPMRFWRLVFQSYSGFNRCKTSICTNSPVISQPNAETMQLHTNTMNWFRCPRTDPLGLNNYQSLAISQLGPLTRCCSLHSSHLEPHSHSLASCQAAHNVGSLQLSTISQHRTILVKF